MMMMNRKAKYIQMKTPIFYILFGSFFFFIPDFSLSSALYLRLGGLAPPQ